MTTPRPVPARSRVFALVGIVVLLVLVLWLVNRSGAEPGAIPTSTVTTGTSASSSGSSTSSSRSSSRSTPDSGLATIAEAQLPKQAQQTLALIRAGGPFPYDADGGVFQNRERLLPRQARTYYREYTVETPGSDDRGARRIIAGERGDLYYTADHYDSFRQIEESP